MRIGMNSIASYAAMALGVAAVPVVMAPQAAADHQRCLAWTCASTPDDGVRVEYVDATLDVCHSGPLEGDTYKFRLRGPGLDHMTETTEPTEQAGSCKNLVLRLDVNPDRTFAAGDRICVEGIRLRRGHEYSMGEPCLPLQESGPAEPAPSGFPIPPSWPEGLNN